MTTLKEENRDFDQPPQNSIFTHKKNFAELICTNIYCF